MNRPIPYIPHTQQDISVMLKAVGVSSVDQLFSDIPESVRLQGSLAVPQGVSEYEALKFMQGLSEMNIRCTSFLGCGIYDHIIPSAVKQVLSTPAFLTSYTPYQPEISQGLLQGIFEFQTMICRLTGMQVSNASLYDGHTAAAEAAAIALQAKRKAGTILVSAGVHPFTRKVLETHYRGSGIKIETVELHQGRTRLEDVKDLLSSDAAALIVQTPNILGVLEDLDGFAEAVHEKKALFIVSSNPMTLGVCRNQASWGADIAIGDTQCFGLPQSFGGPTVGYIAAVEKLLRKMPGRIAGETKDAQGRRAFVLTLQAREQHIKRERATSNICSNQALAAFGTASYLALAGPEGLREAGVQCMSKAHYLYEKLGEIPGLHPVVEAPFFHEFAFYLASPEKAKEYLDRMYRRGIFAGVHLGEMDSRFDGIVVSAVTEKRTREEMDRYAECTREVLA